MKPQVITKHLRIGRERKLKAQEKFLLFFHFSLPNYLPQPYSKQTANYFPQPYLDCHFKSREVDGKLCLPEDWGQGLKTDLGRQRLGDCPGSLFGDPSNLGIQKILIVRILHKFNVRLFTFYPLLSDIRLTTRNETTIFRDTKFKGITRTE